MSFLKNARLISMASRVEEEALYKQANDEYMDGVIRGGLWAKALTLSEGDETKARGVYLKLRVDSIKDDTELSRMQKEREKKEKERLVRENWERDVLGTRDEKRSVEQLRVERKFAISFVTTIIIVITLVSVFNQI